MWFLKPLNTWILNFAEGQNWVLVWQGWMWCLGKDNQEVVA
jgi:hypothetical protein